jgi:Raf kinase inhibitor-like YbhB/YbcL family protein
MAQNRPDAAETRSPRRKVEKARAQQIRLSSTAFADGDRIPDRYTAFGDDVSPPLTWGEPRRATASLALMCEDPDSPSGLFVHWLAWNIHPHARELGEDSIEPDIGDHIREGLNGFGETSYSGPKPPTGESHRYVFHLYALDTRLDLPHGATRADFERAIEGHVLGEGLLTGTYSATESVR